MDKVERESAATVSIARKQELAGAAAQLRRKLDSTQRLAAVVAARPSGAPAATTLLKLDVEQMLGANSQ